MEDPDLPEGTACGRAFPGSGDGKGGKNDDGDASLHIFYLNTHFNLTSTW